MGVGLDGGHGACSVCRAMVPSPRASPPNEPPEAPAEPAPSVLAEEAPPAAPEAGSAKGLFVLLGATACIWLVLMLISDMASKVFHSHAASIAFGALASLSGLVLFAWAGLRTLLALGRAAWRTDPVEAGTWLGLLSAGAFSVLGWLFSAATLGGFTRGRQLRRRGRLLLPALERSGAWGGLPLQPSVPPELRSALARAWRENGRNEHASVAAFAQLTLDLVALGAPPGLLASAQADARDEVRHAELCFSLARALDGEQAGPAPFPEARPVRALPPGRALALSRLAVESLVDGALLEGFSARLIAALVPRCEDAATAALLRELAADEGRHSRHGWDVVEWCLAEGGAPVARALHGALSALPERAKSALPEAARGGGWERFGVAGERLEAQAYEDSRRYVAGRVVAMLAPPPSAP